jgi:hypothetical protein
LTDKDWELAVSPDESMVDRCPESVTISSLTPGHSLRLAGANQQHVRALAESISSLPPILVHRATMRVIDGMHRVMAAVLCGLDEVPAFFYDGDEQAAFVLGVRLNVGHGLPLSLADRTAAAARIIGMHPQWSDRRIASMTGLAGSTVGAIRKRSTAGNEQSHTRLGLDGRERPVRGVEGRKRAGEILAANPNASLREVARVAGVAPSTVRDVREQMRLGRDPLPPKQRGESLPKPSEKPVEQDGDAFTVADLSVMFRRLQKDPSLRFTESGRRLLHWLAQNRAGMTELWQLVDSVPPHCVAPIATLARVNAKAWIDLADVLQRRDDSVDVSFGT